MKYRILTIAVEDYAESRVLAKRLEGTTENAVKFVDSLVELFNIDSKNILFCSSRPSKYTNCGATREEITEELAKFITQGANTTDCLFVFLSGHGLMKPGEAGDPHSDVLLCSDFKSSNLSGAACILVDELTTLLARSLGAGTHLTFVDACRTVDRSIQPSKLGINPAVAANGTADQLCFLAARAGEYAVNDELFVNAVIRCLRGENSLEPDQVDRCLRWVTFQSIVADVAKDLEQAQRFAETKIEGKSNYQLRSLKRAGEAMPIVDKEGKKAPPVELLERYDDVVFLGETNSQLAGKPRDRDWKLLDQQNYLELAFSAREGRRWKRLEIFSVEDLATAGRVGRSVKELQQEREEAEEYLRSNASRLAEELRVYRYEYAGVYGSLWTAADGRRRSHTSPRVLGFDIRSAPAYDFVDFPDDRLATIEGYFAIPKAIRALPSTRCVFSYPS